MDQEPQPQSKAQLAEQQRVETQNQGNQHLQNIREKLNVPADNSSVARAQESAKLAELRRRLASARTVVVEPNRTADTISQREGSQISENARPANELERRAAEVYKSYFGPNWRDVLGRELLLML